MKIRLPRCFTSNAAFPPLLLLALVYSTTLLTLERRDFWVVDNANKYLQMRGILDSGYSDFSIPWPGRSIDPDFEYNPIPLPFSKVREGKLYSTMPPFFAMVSSFLYRAFGFWGLYVLPFICSLMAFWGIARLAEMVSPEPAVKRWAVLIGGLCTPMWFYSVVFWEHLPAVCLCTWAVFCALRHLRGGRPGYLFAGAGLSALAVYFRDDLYVFCVVLFVVTVFYAGGRRWKTAALGALGMALAIIPLWLFQWKTLGEPLGFHLDAAATTTTGLMDHIAGRPKIAYKLFFASHADAIVSLLLGLPFVVALLWHPAVEGRTGGRVSVLFISLAVLASLVWFVGRSRFANAIEWMFETNSLFVVSPILILGFMGHRREKAPPENTLPARYLWTVILAYAVLYAATTHTFVAGGVHWGNRYLLLLYPLFALFAGVNLVELSRRGSGRFVWRGMVAAAVVLSLVAQGYSIDILREKKAFSRRLNVELARYPEKIVITNVWWVPQTLHAGFYDKSFFLAVSRKQLEELVDKLSARGYERAVFVVGPSDVGEGSEAVRVEDTRFGYFSLAFMVRDFGAPRP